MNPKIKLMILPFYLFLTQLVKHGAPLTTTRSNCHQYHHLNGHFNGIGDNIRIGTLCRPQKRLTSFYRMIRNDSSNDYSDFDPPEDNESDSDDDNDDGDGANDDEKYNILPFLTEKDSIDYKMRLVRSLQNSFYMDSFSSASLSPNNRKDCGRDDTSSEKVKLTRLHSSGMIENLIIWRVQWTELPGRSNVLTINQPVYTNMFETLLRRNEMKDKGKMIGNPNEWKELPLYFGQIFCPDVSDNSRRSYASNDKDDETTDHDEENKQQEMKVNFKSWKERIHHEKTKETCGRQLQNYDSVTWKKSQSAVVGTLVRIMDYRRMSDGRLLLYVQAVERFVVEQVDREFPYAIANVQLLPDLEELDAAAALIKEEVIYALGKRAKSVGKPSFFLSEKEELAKKIRSKALKESFRFHSYEYDNNVKLPVRNDGKEITVDDIYGPRIAKIMPHVPLSCSIDPDKLPKGIMCNLQNYSNSEDNNSLESQLCLEYRLINGGILQEPPVHPEVPRSSHLTLEQLEQQIWNNIDQYFRIRNGGLSAPPNIKRKEIDEGRGGMQLSPELLSLLPRNMKWPKDFVLEEVAEKLSIDEELKQQYHTQSSVNDCNVTKNLVSLSHPFVRVAETYPPYRRQRRLSFAASAMIEIMQVGGGRGVRQSLLEMPTTRGRLCSILERYEVLNNQLMGEFL